MPRKSIPSRSTEKRVCGARRDDCGQPPKTLEVQSVGGGFVNFARKEISLIVSPLTPALSPLRGEGEVTGVFGQNRLCRFVLIESAGSVLKTRSCSGVNNLTAAISISGSSRLRCRLNQRKTGSCR